MAAHLRLLRGYASAIAILAVLSGCSDATDARRSASHGAADDAEQATFAEHDHGAPPHRPADFPHAVAELRRRHVSWTASTFARGPQAFGREHQELRDIVGWLPMLAADSDLSEAEWLPIKQAAERLTTFYGDSATAGSNGESPTAPERIRAAERDIAALEAISAQHATAFDATHARSDCVAHAVGGPDRSPAFQDSQDATNP